MKIDKKLALTVGIIVVVFALVCVFGYFALFVGADTVKLLTQYCIRDEGTEYLIPESDARIGGDGLLYIARGENKSALEGKGFPYETVKSLPGAHATTLTAWFAGEDRYVKLGDISQPFGFQTVKDAPDRDGDSLTTQFDMLRRDKAAGDLSLCVYAYMADEQAVQAQGFVKQKLTYPQDGSNKAAAKAKINYEAYVKSGEGVTLCLFESPYDQAFICAEFTYPEGYDEFQLQLSVFETAAKITPGKQFHPLVSQFRQTFVDDDRWEYLLKGLGVTLLITLCSGLIGVVLGAIVAIIRATWEKNHENMRPGLGKGCLKAVDKLCGVYLTVIRGTPVMVQLLIMYLIIFASAKNGTVSAILAFGINSGAYVAEIVRGGIMSIDNGQFEAGASLGFNYSRTMIYIILPQAFRNILPALANEFIALLKETSVSGYVAVKDLNKAGESIRGTTHLAFMPLIAVALIYLGVVMFFTQLVKLLERRLRSSDHR